MPLLVGMQLFCARSLATRGFGMGNFGMGNFGMGDAETQTSDAANQ
ncbi:MAG: hypothetical protein ACYC5H_02880 [Methylovirgula sp.]